MCVTCSASHFSFDLFCRLLQPTHTYIHAATVLEVRLFVLQEMKEDLSKVYMFTAVRSSKNNEFATESIV